MQPATPADTPPPAASQAKPPRRLFRRLVLASALVAVVAFVTLLISSSSEPEYQGVVLSKWIDRYNDNVDADPQRAEAAGAVRHIGIKAVPFLTKWAAATDSPFKQKLEEWLDEKFPSLTANMTDADDLHQRAFTGFLLLGPQAKTAIPDLRPLLFNTNTADTAAEILCMFIPETTPALIAGLTNNNPDIRSVTASAISEWNQGAELLAATHARQQIILPFSVVTNLLEDSDSEVRIVAIQSLATAATNKAMPPKAAVALLMEQLKDTDFECRLQAANALTNFGSDAAVAIPALLDILKNGTGLSPASRVTINLGTNFTVALPTYKTGFTSQVAQAVPPQTVLRYARTAQRAAMSGSFVVPPTIMPTTMSVTGSDGGYVVRALQALHADPAQVIAILENQLLSSDAETCYWAIDGLESYGAQAKSSVPQLLKLGAGENAVLRMTIYRALDKIDPATAHANSKLLDVDYQDSKLVLIERANLSNADPFVRRVAAIRLGNIGPTATYAVPELEKLLNDKDDTVRAAAAEALQKISPVAAAKAGIK